MCAQSPGVFNYGVSSHNNDWWWYTMPNLFRWRNSGMTPTGNEPLCLEADGFALESCTGNNEHQVTSGFHVWEANKPPSGTGSAKSCARHRQNNNGNTIANPSYYWDPISCTTLQPYVCYGLPPAPPQSAASFQFATCYELDGSGDSSKFHANVLRGHPIVQKRPGALSDVQPRFTSFEDASTVACRWWPTTADDVLSLSDQTAERFYFYMDSEDADTNPYITKIGEWLPVTVDLGSFVGARGIAHMGSTTTAPFPSVLFYPQTSN